ncbi:MAG TPA: SBBP repeat-containing protein [Pyrinomonadaceae bacterium]|nr:SBBP repeat-containing protein [Pyrinomonadaceae bacterium]
MKSSSRRCSSFISRTAAPALLALFVASLSILPYFRAARQAAGGLLTRDVPRQAEAGQAAGALVSPPMLFEPNEGQADPGVKFVSRGDGYTLALTPDAALLTLDEQETGPSVPPEAPAREASTSPRACVLSMRPVGGGRGASVRGGRRAPGRVNYFVGSERVTNVPVFDSVVYGEVYPGVDLVYYGAGGRLEYDFRLAPGANPEAIEMAFDGADKLEVDGGGDLVVHAAGRRLVQKSPKVYQEEGGGRVEVAGRYVLRGESSVGFEVGAYDAARPLVIDPVLAYATYNISALDIKFDRAGNLYVIGGVRPAPAPNTNGADVLVSKFAPNSSGGLDLVYTTRFGGSNYDAGDVAVDKSGNVYVAGVTTSLDFPVTPDAFQSQLNRGTPDTSDAGTCCKNLSPQDAFVARLGPAGELLYASYFGGSGSDSAKGPLLDAAGNVYLVGGAGATSNNFPTTANAYMPSRPTPASDPRDQPVYDANSKKLDLYIAKFTPQGNGLGLAYSTYFGGNRADFLNTATVDADGNVYLAGHTGSTDFPVTANALRSQLFATPTVLSASTAVTSFLTKFNPSGTGAAAVPYSTFLGSIEVGTRDIKVDGAGQVYLLNRVEDGNNCHSTGRMYADWAPLCDSVPITAGAMQPSFRGGVDLVLMKLNLSAPTGESSLIYSTFFGGSADDDAFNMELDEAGNVYVAGRTFSTDFPVTPGAFQTAFGGGATEDISAPGGDSYLAKIDSAGASLVYFTYLGGSAGDGTWIVRRDARGSLYVSGWTYSNNFPVTDGSTYNGAQTSTSFLVKISPDAVASDEHVPFDASHARDPLDDSSKFVRQHYLDFLSREPDAPGLAHWTNEIEQCGADLQCREVRRINVSAAFFQSIEFERTGYLVYLAHRAAYGRMPLYEEFSPDARDISRGVAVGAAGWEALIDTNERAYLDSFVARPQFGALYGGMSQEQYVNALFANAGVAPSSSERDQLVSDLTSGAKTRAQVLRAVAENASFSARERNRAFILMEYFGYLRRNPDEEGLNYWLDKLDKHNGNFVEAESVKAFLDAVEYHDRFKTVPRRSS